MGNAGRVLMIPKGDYNAAMTYEMLDCVYYNGRSYVCKQTSTGNAPTNTTYWQVMTPDSSAEIQALTNEVRGNWATGGVNLFDKSIMSDVDYEGVYKELHLKPNTTYTASTTLPKNINNAANFFAYNSSGSASTNVSGLWDGQTRTITTNNDGIINIMYRNREYDDTSVSWFLNHEFQIEVGSTATPYQPYAKTNVELTQDDNGLTANAFANGCVNLLENTATSATVNGITFTVNSDKTVTANGTATADALLPIGKSPIGEYILSGCPAKGAHYKYCIYVGGQYLYETGEGLKVNFTASRTIQILIKSGQTINNFVFKPMITVADMPNSDYNHYVPYAKSNKELTQDVMFKKVSYTHSSNVSIAAGAYADITIDTFSLPTGYSVIGLLAYYPNSSYAALIQIVPKNGSVRVRNMGDGEISVKPMMELLLVKDSLITT